LFNLKTRTNMKATIHGYARARWGVFVSEHAQQVLPMLLAAIMPCLAPSVRAQVTYTYTGSPFTYVGTYGTDVTHISGSFSLASALPPNYTYLLTPDTIGGTILNYSFTDGRDTLTMANYATSNSLGYGSGQSHPTFAVTTGSSGQITAWDLNILSPAAWINLYNVTNPTMWTSDPVYSTLFNEGTTPVDGIVANPSAPYNANAVPSSGSWSVSGIPEPSTYAALFGLAALGFAVLRRLKTLRA
jgi:hypothetical protein